MIVTAYSFSNVCISKERDEEKSETERVKKIGKGLGIQNEAGKSFFDL